MRITYPMSITTQLNPTVTDESKTGVLYASTQAPGSASEDSYRLLCLAVQRLLRSLPEEPSTPEVLCELRYGRLAASESDDSASLAGAGVANVLLFSDPTFELAFDDRVLEQVRNAWEKITGETGGFMLFEERGESGEDDSEEM